MFRAQEQLKAGYDAVPPFGILAFEGILEAVAARFRAMRSRREGAAHCSFAQLVVDPAVPETREAWDVTIKSLD